MIVCLFCGYFLYFFFTWLPRYDEQSCIKLSADNKNLWSNKSKVFFSLSITKCLECMRWAYGYIPIRDESPPRENLKTGGTNPDPNWPNRWVLSRGGSISHLLISIQYRYLWSKISAMSITISISFTAALFGLLRYFIIASKVVTDVNVIPLTSVSN